MLFSFFSIYVITGAEIRYFSVKPEGSERVLNTGLGLMLTNHARDKDEFCNFFFSFFLFFRPPLRPLQHLITNSYLYINNGWTRTSTYVKTVDRNFKRNFYILRQQ